MWIETLLRRKVTTKILVPYSTGQMWIGTQLLRKAVMDILILRATTTFGIEKMSLEG